jgi:hypothetical protein
MFFMAAFGQRPGVAFFFDLVRPAMHAGTRHLLAVFMECRPILQLSSKLGGHGCFRLWGS